MSKYNTSEPQKGSMKPATVTLNPINRKISTPTTAKELLNNPPDPVKESVEGLVDVGLTLLLASSTLARTKLAIYMAACLSQGKDVFQKRSTQISRVFYLSLAEDTLRFSERLKQVDRSPIGVNLFNFEIATHCKYEDGNFIAFLNHVITKRRYDVIIIDSIYETMSLRTRGNRRREFEHVRKLKNLANDMQVAIIAVQHSNKNDLETSISQARTLEAVADNAILVASAYKEEVYEISVLRHYGRLYAKQDVYLRSQADSFEFTELDEQPVLESESSLLDKVELLSRHGMTQKDIAIVLDLSQGYVSKLIQKIDSSGFSEELVFDDIEEFIDSEPETVQEDKKEEQEQPDS
jgi:RecA-family ATPase